MLNKLIYQNKGCDLSKCTPMTRHRRDRNQLTKYEHLLNHIYFSNDHIPSQQIFDRIHCHCMHTFDTGYLLKDDDKLISHNKQNDIAEVHKSNSKQVKFVREEVPIPVSQYSHGWRFYY